MDYYLAIAYQLPDLAHYRYCYLMMLFHAYLMLLWLVHVYETQKCMMTIVGLVHRKCIKHKQLIIRLVHLIIVVVSTWNYMVMNSHESQLKIKAVATVDCGSSMCCDIGAIRQRHG